MLCEDTGCCPEDLHRAMNDREEWRERVRDIRATQRDMMMMMTFNVDLCSENTRSLGKHMKVIF